MNWRKFVIVVFIFIILILFISFVLVKLTEKKDFQLSIEPQTKIICYSRATVQPLIINRSSQISIKIKIESHQNPDFVNSEISKIIMLEDNIETPYKILSYQELSKTEYATTGIANFELPVKAKFIKLIIFECENAEFIWTIDAFSRAIETLKLK
jgi:hypothetical protein